MGSGVVATCVGSLMALGFCVIGLLSHATLASSDESAPEPPAGRESPRPRGEQPRGQQPRGNARPHGEQHENPRPRGEQHENHGEHHENPRPHGEQHDNPRPHGEPQLTERRPSWLDLPVPTQPQQAAPKPPPPQLPQPQQAAPKPPPPHPPQPQQVPPKSRPAQPPQMPPAAPPQVAQPQQPRGEVLTEPLVMSTLFVRGWRRGGAFTPEIRRARDDLTRMCADYICGHCGRRGVGCQEGSNSYWLQARCVCGRTMLKRRLAGI